MYYADNCLFYSQYSLHVEVKRSSDGSDLILGCPMMVEVKRTSDGSDLILRCPMMEMALKMVWPTIEVTLQESTTVMLLILTNKVSNLLP